jgi:transposase
METTTVAIDLAKDVFQVAMANRAGRIVHRQRLTRRQFERFLETLDPTWWRRPGVRTFARCR